MNRRASVVAAILLVAACHRSSGGRTPDPDAPPGSSASVPSPASDVRLTWTLLDTRRWIGGDGEQHQSSTFALSVDHGVPSRVTLGERASFGCTVREATDGAARGLACHDGAHGEYVNVTRPSPVELRIEAFGLDDRPDAPRANVHEATIQIPDDAVLVVDRELTMIPDDATPRPRDVPDDSRRVPLDRFRAR